MANTAIDDILKAIHNAAIEAQQLTEQQHIRQMHRYFDPETGRALTIPIQIPNTDINAEEGKEFIEVEVPMLTLMPPTSIKIKEMEVEFEVTMSGFANQKKEKKGFHFKKKLRKDTPESPETDAEPSEGSEDPEEGQEEEEPEDTHSGPLHVDLKSGFAGFGGTKAKIRIVLVGCDPPEALMKIDNELVKVLP